VAGEAADDPKLTAEPRFSAGSPPMWPFWAHLLVLLAGGSVYAAALWHLARWLEGMARGGG
jgi:hypothetical protein